ncbi:MAG: DegT/DnrJ/EryC1/StrS family aminotransferase [Actinomycetota bacterium]
MSEPVAFLDLNGLHAEIRDEVDRRWAELVSTSGFIGDPYLGRFEERWAEYCGTTEAIGVANGTDALELILRGLGIGPGDEVIVPTNTFFATPEAVTVVGATPVFVDVDPDSLLVTADHVRAAITPRTAAVMAVHLFGHPVDLTAIAAVCDTAGIALVEDAAQAHGAEWDGRRIGSFGVAAGFSFYPGKNLGAFGDGGAVVTSDAELARDIRTLANHGQPAGTKYRHHVVGRNSRLDGLQAAVLDVKLDHIDRWNEARRAAFDVYADLVPRGLIRPLEGSVAVHHLVEVRVPERGLVQKQLAEEGIGSGIHYPVPCHRTPAYAVDQQPDLPVAERAAAEILSVPMHPLLGRSDVERVCEVLAATLDRLS